MGTSRTHATLPPIGPFLKWAGGKGQLLPQLARFLPSTLEGRRYIEPFVGSGAMFFYVIQNLRPDVCILLDVNPELIHTWRVVRDNVDELIALLAAHQQRHNRTGITEEERREYYAQVRACVPEPSAERAARFIYLNKTCFNGLHRLNSRGQFNVPMGRYRQPTLCVPDHLRQASRLLCDVILEVCPFQECERYIGAGDFVYCDPPYAPLSRTAHFTGYAKEEFTAEHQRALRDLLRRISPHCQWMLSNSAAPLIDELYTAPEFHIYSVLAGRAINSASERRGKIEERVITNYDPAARDSAMTGETIAFTQEKLLQ